MIRQRLTVVLFLFVFFVVSSSAAAERYVDKPGQQLSVPATFVRYVKAPGAADDISRPTAVHWDRFHQEILVADFGNSRIMIFAPSGSYKFEFRLGSAITAPIDIVTDPEGYIYVLGSSPKGYVLNHFDFDGLSLGSILLPQEYNAEPVTPGSICCDAEGRLYLLDKKSHRILFLDPESGIAGSFPIERENQDGDTVFGVGRLAISGDELLIPVSTGGTIQRYGLTGEFRGYLGHFGSKPGSLNFPVAVEVSPEGIIAVLDQGRFCIVCYGSDGHVLGEFGGKGTSPGWFMNPSLMAITSADRVVIGQIYENKIQICALPEFVRGRNRNSANETNTPQRKVSARSVGFYGKDDFSHLSYPINSLSSGSSDPHQPVSVSHLEVSE